MRDDRRQAAALCAAALAAATVLAALALALAGVPFDVAPTILAGVALVAAAIALAGLRAAARAATRHAEGEQEARRLLDEQRQHEQERLDAAAAGLRSELADRDRELTEERAARAALETELLKRVQEVDAAKAEGAAERSLRRRIEGARRAERDWNRELRGQIARMHSQRGALGDTGDIRALVLHVAITLLGAEKGMLLSRADDEDPLAVVCAEGFDSDPRESRLARRFAHEVIRDDETVRDDSPGRDGPGESAADREIHNLVAIPIYLQDRFHGAVVCANKDGGFDEYDDEVLLALGDHAGAVLENSRLHSDLRDAYVATVRLLSEAIQAKDPFLRGHSEEVSEYVVAVADKLGVEPHRREELMFGSLLHDVGKIGISERILLKPAALLPEERGIIELHPRIGFRLLEQVPALRAIAPAVLHHHERWDGAGYPDRLAGKEIPLESRIICVADSFSAMTADRPYRERMSIEDACAELERCAGSQFDPDVVGAFVEEVRNRPHTAMPAGLAEALADPEVDRRRAEGEPVLGAGPLALTDNLTLLYTHRYFHEVVAAQVERAADSGRPFAVVLAELTEIAPLNQLEGYAAGDEAIRAVARVVQRAAVRCGGTACRYSGRRIALVVPEADQANVDRITADVGAGVAAGPRVALGAAVWQPGDSRADVIARARLGLVPVA